MSEFIVNVPDEDAKHFIERFGIDGTTLYGYHLTGEIVRCRDCKKLNIVGECPCGFWALENGKLDGFCAWGERRDAE